MKFREYLNEGKKELNEGKTWDDIDPKKMAKEFKKWVKTNDIDVVPDDVEEWLNDLAGEFNLEDSDSEWEANFHNELKKLGFKNTK